MSEVSPYSPLSVPPKNKYLLNFECYHDIRSHLTFKYFNKTNVNAMQNPDEGKPPRF
jgi:hypothetical protein